MAAAAGATAYRPAPTRRSTSTGRRTRPRSASSASRASKTACRQSVPTRVSDACATWASCSTTWTRSSPPLRRAIRARSTTRCSMSSPTPMTPRSSRPRAERASRKRGSRRLRSRPSTRSSRNGSSAYRSIRSSARCRWYGTCRLSRQSRAAWRQTATCRKPMRCASPLRTSPRSSLRATRLS